MVTPADPDAHGADATERAGADTGGPGPVVQPGAPARAPDPSSRQAAESSTPAPDQARPAAEESTGPAPGGNGSTPPAGSDAAAGDVRAPVPPPMPPAPTERPRRVRTGQVVLGIVAFLTVAFLVGAAFVPLPYYLFRPGSVRDTQPLIQVEGTEVFPSDGSIGYTTVSLRQATLLGLAQGWLDDDVDVFARDEVLRGRDVDENRAVNLQMMSDSKQVATQVALERLGYDVDITVGQLVIEVLPDTPADGVLEAGDTITAVDGESFDDSQDLGRLLADDAPGSTIVATVQPPAGGPGRDVELALAESPDQPGKGVMGVRVMDVVLDYDFPVDVEIDTGDVGGPSAGLAFTLGIIDDLTPGDLTGGEDVAVTGTISGDGTVGPVGGTGQKAAAVREAGMTLFLVPSADYDAAVEHAGDDLEVVAVDTVEEALAALGNRGGNVDDLPAAGETAAPPPG
jgi:PDZ domain-containing protein